MVNSTVNPSVAAMPSVKLQDLIDAFDWVSADGGFENAAYVCRQSGKIYWVGEGGALGDEELPDDIEDGALYVAVPHKRELDLGRMLALRFVEAHVPAAYERAQRYFARPGAYGHFKHMLGELGKLNAWYQYEQQAIADALQNWAEENELTILEKPGDEG